MLYKTCLFVLFLFCLALTAEVIFNPDDNTLWSEDGKSFPLSEAVSAGAWQKTDMEFFCADEQGVFGMGGSGTMKNTRYFPVSKEYPWLELELQSITQYSGYKAWTMFFRGGQGIGQVTHPQEGVYVHNIYATGDTKESGMEYLAIYIYNLKLNMSRLRVLKKPDYYLTVESEAFEQRKSFAPGDSLDITVFMKEPAEDVMLRFVDNYGVKQMRINKQDKLQLKPIDEADCIWQCKVQIEQLGSQSKYRAGQIMLKTIILAGGIDKPVWSAIQFPYQVNP